METSSAFKLFGVIEDSSLVDNINIASQRPVTGCSLGIGDRRILRLLSRILRLNFDDLELHISYSDEEPLCSRKLYLAKMVSFFPRRYTQNVLNK